MCVSGWISFPEKRQTFFFDIFFFGGSDFCVSASSFSFSALFCFIARFFSGCRTNSEQTLALSFLFELIFSVLNFLGFGRAKTLELQLVDALFVQIQCYQGNKNIETCLIQVFHAKNNYFIRPKSGKPFHKPCKPLSSTPALNLSSFFGLRLFPG